MNFVRDIEGMLLCDRLQTRRNSTLVGWPTLQNGAICLPYSRLIILPFPDTENPKVSTCPTSFEVRLNPGERNRLIFWQEPTFTDNVGVERVYKIRVRERERQKERERIAIRFECNPRPSHVSVSSPQNFDRLISEKMTLHDRPLLFPTLPRQPSKTADLLLPSPFLFASGLLKLPL